MIAGTNSGYSQYIKRKDFVIKRGDTFTYKLDEFNVQVNDFKYKVDWTKAIPIGHIKKQKDSEYSFASFDFSISDNGYLILHLDADTTRTFEPKKYWYDIEIIWEAPEYGTNEDGDPVNRHNTILQGYIRFTRDITILRGFINRIYNVLFNNKITNNVKYAIKVNLQYIFKNTIWNKTTPSLKNIYYHIFKNTIWNKWTPILPQNVIFSFSNKITNNRTFNSQFRIFGFSNTIDNQISRNSTPQ